MNLDRDAGVKAIVGAGTGIGPVGVGGGIMFDILKNDEITVPYIDENKIIQAPRFRINFPISSLKPEEWASRLYNAIVEARKNSIEQSSEILSSDDPLQVLKLRLAKGEITKEQYDDLRKILDDS